MENLDVRCLILANDLVQEISYRGVPAVMITPYSVLPERLYMRQNPEKIS